MAIEKLTALQAAKAKVRPGERVRYLGDGKGLYLRVTSTGGKSWIYKYMHRGRAHELGLGAVDIVTLAEARAKARELRRQRSDGQDPLTMIRAATRAASPVFRDFAEAYIDKQAPRWRGKKTEADWRQTFRDFVYPILGNMRLEQIGTQHVLQAITPLWERSTDRGRRTRQRVETILNAAGAAGHRDPTIPNPARWSGHLEHLLNAPDAAAENHYESMPYKDVPAFMRELAGMGTQAARALRFLIFTTVRAGPLIGATWDEFDLEAKLWTIPVARMKEKHWGDFRIPLSAAAAELLATNVGSARPFPIKDSAMRMLLARKGLPATPHGFRASFSTWAAEETIFPDELREACLAHFPGNRTAAAYQRGDLLARRRQLMEAWAMFLTGSEADVIPLRRA